MGIKARQRSGAPLSVAEFRDRFSEISDKLQAAVGTPMGTRYRAERVLGEGGVVYDVGRTDDGSVFVVSKLINGSIPKTRCR